MGLFSRKRKRKAPIPAPPPEPVIPPPLEQWSALLQNGLTIVQAAANRCADTHGAEQVAAWRDLRQTLHDELAKLDALIGPEPWNPRHRRMMRVVVDEMWETAAPWLNLTFVRAHDIRLTTDEMADLQRDLWAHAEAVTSTYLEARGADVATARERMHRVVDQIKADSATRLPMSERQALMWQLAADEITQFVADAVARHPES